VTVTDLDAVVCETHIAAPPHAVFAYFVDPAKMVLWMGARAEIDPRPGGAYAVDLNAQARARGQYVDVVPDTRIVFSFGWEENPTVPPGSTTVEVTFTPDGDGTHVRLVHRGLVGAESRAQHTDGWQHYLARLAVAGGGGDPGPDPNAADPVATTGDQRS
jgi:uncharacterized protein YndB with AHSA1/START domain